MDSAFKSSAGVVPAQSISSSDSGDRERAAEHSHMLSDVARILALTPEQRLQELANVAKFVASARRV